MAKKQQKILQPQESYAEAIVSLVPAIIFSSIVIMIVKAAQYSMPLTQFFWTEMQDDSIITDFFALEKRTWVFIATILAVLVLIYKWMRNNFKVRFEKRTMYYFTGAYLALVILSFIFSPYKEFAWGGFKERFEGTSTIICYIFMMLFIAHTVKSDKGLKVMLYSIGVSMLVIGGIGIGQALGHDLFQTVLGQKLITPNVMLENGMKAWKYIDQVTADGSKYYNFTFTNREVYSTVYNINYVPLFLSAVLPLFAILFIRSWKADGYDKKQKMIAGIFSGVVYAVCLVNFFCANSASGYFGLVTMFVSAVIIFRKKLAEYIKPLVALVLVTVLVAGICWERWLPEVKEKVFGAAESVVATAYADESAAEVLTVDKILTGDNWFSMTISGHTLKCTYSVDEFAVTDENGEAVALKPTAEQGVYEFADERYSKFCKLTLASGENSLFYAIINTDDGTRNTDWVFLMSSDQVYYQTPVGKFTTISEVPSWGFENNYHFGTDRGYIYARSIPMLKSTLLLGHGADTYCIYFPQYDYAGKYTIQGNILLVTDKPHCMYLGIATGTGVVSLIAWLGIIVCLFMECRKNCFKLSGKNELIEFAGCGSFIGAISFMAVGTFNDSSISVMPLFYSVVGICFACNWILAKMPEKEQAEA